MQQESTRQYNNRTKTAALPLISNQLYRLL